MPNVHPFAVLGKSDAELREATRRAGLALRPDELNRIAAALGRDPTIVEAYAFDAQWSEHCSYKSSRHHLKKLPTTGDRVVLGVGQDAGIVHLGEHDGRRYGVVVAHESHNHPSQVVPYEGAATGVGGIVRDVLCMGAEVVAVADALRFGRTEDAESHQRYVATGVVDGIAGYGNAIGVPNVTGDVYFDERFNDNCLVNVVAVGVVDEANIIHSAAPPDSDGWDIVLVGKATDASGFGGASFSSLSLDAADAEANKGAVQVPDPFLKNVIMRASYRVFAYLRENQITAGFKDLGAGGIMGCTAEICASGGFGAIIDLDDVSTAQDNLPPAVVAIGETQERLTWIVPGHVTPELLRIYNEEFSLPQIAKGACAAVIGCVQKEKRYVMRSGDEIVMDVDIDFLTGSIKDELPYHELTSQRAAPQQNAGVDVAGGAHPLDVLERVLAHRDVCSREPLFKQYDSVVRGATVLRRGQADAGVVMVPDTPLAFAVSVAGNPRYGKCDPASAGAWAVGEAVRRVVAVGAEPAALTDCLNYGNPQNEDDYSELVAGIGGLAAAARAHGVPFVSGNVSLYNEAKGGAAIPASPVVSCIGTFSDASHIVTPGLKRAGNRLYFFGAYQDALGGSVLADLYSTGGAMPDAACATDRTFIELLGQARRAGIVRACRAVGDGGVLVTLAKMCFDPGARAATLGVSFDGQCEAAQNVRAAFGEHGGFVVELAERPPFEDRVHYLGAVNAGGTFEIGGRALPVEQLHQAWSRPLAEVFG